MQFPAQFGHLLDFAVAEVALYYLLEAVLNALATGGFVPFLYPNKVYLHDHLLDVLELGGVLDPRDFNPALVILSRVLPRKCLF